MTKNTVKKYVDLLEEHRLIRTRPSQIIKRDGTRQNGNLIYHIEPNVIAWQYRQKQLMAKNDLELERVRIRLAAQKTPHRAP